MPRVAWRKLRMRPVNSKGLFECVLPVLDSFMRESRLETPVYNAASGLITFLMILDSVRFLRDVYDPYTAYLSGSGESVLKSLVLHFCGSMVRRKRR